MVATYVPKFSYIIPFKFRQDRIIPLRRVIDWLAGFQGIEVIVIEQDTHSKINHLNLKAKHIFIESSAPFNKSWAYNVAIKYAQSNVILFGDGDFIMDPMKLIESLKLIENYDCVIPTNKVLKLNQQQSAMDTGSILNMIGTNPKTSMFDGLSIFKKDAIRTIAGWNEDMIGVGYENEFMEIKAKKMLKVHQSEDLGYHLFHFPENTSKQLLERNKQILDFYSKDTNPIEHHINQTAAKIGIGSRFSTFTT